MSDRNRLINALLIVVAIVLLWASIYSVYLAWRTGLDQSRAETASRLMAIRTSPRTTETPGINAWVSWSLLSQFAGGDENSNEGLRHLVLPNSSRQFPGEFTPLLKTLQLNPSSEKSIVVFKQDDAFGGRTPDEGLEFRRVTYVANGNEVLVLTARDNEVVQAGIEQFAESTSQHLIDIKKVWAADPQLPKFENYPQIRSARVARFYVLNEDESLISLPIGDVSEKPGNKLILSEGAEFRKNPLSPSFVSNNFFFDFRFEQPLDEQSSYSGMYLDLGGLGLVVSIMRPAIYNGQRCVLGADVALDVDWNSFSHHLSSNLISHVAEIENSDGYEWNPWNEFSRSLPDSATELKRATRELAERESLSILPKVRKSVYLVNTVDGGDLMAIQVDRSTWLLLLVSPDEIKLPWALMLLTSAVFLCLLLRIEWSRRQAVNAQRSAKGEMQEKQNLLDTMQVPLMVVDPNTDEVVFCNNAAQSIGMRQGCHFGKDIVAVDSESQKHYRKTQTLGDEHRRAYGIPIRVDSADHSQNRHAIIRSVAVTAPIESLKADQRHRLGILFLVDEQGDLALLLNSRINETKTDEKRRLAGLMNHGIDALARILNNQLSSKGRSGITGESDDELTQWLGKYLSERIQLLSWTLENWGGVPSTTEQRVIEKATFLKTIEQNNRIFEIAGRDRLLREQLHWNNGLLADIVQSNDVQTVINCTTDWDDDTFFAVPREGVFGFILSEIFVNAVRHGAPTKEISCSVVHNRQRNELEFTFLNKQREHSRTGLFDKPFGGYSIINELARLCDWPQPQFKQDAKTFLVSLTVPAIRRTSGSQGD